jgi:hypothetical protein
MVEQLEGKTRFWLSTKNVSSRAIANVHTKQGQDHCDFADRFFLIGGEVAYPPKQKTSI